MKRVFRQVFQEEKKMCGKSGRGRRGQKGPAAAVSASQGVAASLVPAPRAHRRLPDLQRRQHQAFPTCPS